LIGIGTHNLVDGTLMKERNGASSLFDDAARSNPFLPLVSYDINPWPLNSWNPTNDIIY